MEAILAAVAVGCSTSATSLTVDVAVAADVVAAVVLASLCSASSLPHPATARPITTATATTSRTLNNASRPFPHNVQCYSTPSHKHARSPCPSIGRAPWLRVWSLGLSGSGSPSTSRQMSSRHVELAAAEIAPALQCSVETQSAGVENAPGHRSEHAGGRGIGGDVLVKSCRTGTPECSVIEDPATPVQTD